MESVDGTADGATVDLAVMLAPPTKIARLVARRSPRCTYTAATLRIVDLLEDGSQQEVTTQG